MYKSARNIDGVKVLPAAEFNCYDGAEAEAAGADQGGAWTPCGRQTKRRQPATADCERRCRLSHARHRPRPVKYSPEEQDSGSSRKPWSRQPGLDLRPYQVILRPLVTEKGTHQSTRYNAYAFQVNPIATKTQIKDAVEELFHVRVEDVRTQIRHGKKRRFRKMGQTAGLEEGHRDAAHGRQDRVLLTGDRQ